MRRTAAWLSLPAYLSTSWALRSWLAPDSALDLILVLLPALLVLAAAVGRGRAVPPALQVVGTLGMLASWAFPAWASHEILFEIVRTMPFLGLAAVSLAEAAFFARRPPTPDPEGRLTRTLLIFVPAQVTLWIAYDLRVVFDPDVRSLPSLREWVLAVGPSIGLGCVLLLAAWGLGRDRRWTLWAAVAASTLNLVAETIPYLSGKASAGFYLVASFGEHVLLAAIVVLLVRRLRRLRQEAAPAR